MTHRTASMAAPTASALALFGIQLLLGAEAGAPTSTPATSSAPRRAPRSAYSTCRRPAPMSSTGRPIATARPN